VSGTGQIVALAAASLLLCVGFTVMLDVGRLAQRLARFNRWFGSSVPAWIREGPSTFGLDAAGMRVFAGGILGVGMVFLWFAIDARAGSAVARAVVLPLAAGTTLLALWLLLRQRRS
jgi:hypothetical protein